jgi:hypothetical protein
MFRGPCLLRCRGVQRQRRFDQADPMSGGLSAPSPVLCTAYFAWLRGTLRTACLQTCSIRFS